jgi:predicted dehydrogenase
MTDSTRPTRSNRSLNSAGSVNRRDFLKRSAATAAGVGFWIAGRGAWAQELASAPPSVSPNEKLNVGFVGVANRAQEDLNETAGTGMVNVVALCDVDDRFLAKAADKFPKAQTYADWRKLLEQKDIDAVVVGTPDHTHAVASAAALRLGKHVYCEKPLTHTVREARVVAELAMKHNRVTQMGTQIHAGGNYRRTVELVRSGAIGPVKEVHVWCNSIWSASQPPKVEQPVPEGLHYDLWVGPAPFRPYNKAYLPEIWRRYWNFGDGTLGDMACHYMDLPFWALGLRHPSKVRAEGPEVNPDCCPPGLIVHYDFPARQVSQAGGERSDTEGGELPPVRLTWYDGGKRPPQFADWGLNPKWASGVMFVGEKGNLFADYGQHRLFPEKDFADFKAPPTTIPDSVGHHKEWVLACLKNDPGATTCRFDYAGPLTEAVLLGNVAYRSGKELEWDAASLKATNAPGADEFLHYEYRKGWEL